MTYKIRVIYVKNVRENYNITRMQEYKTNLKIEFNVLYFKDILNIRSVLFVYFHNEKGSNLSLLTFQLKYKRTKKAVVSMNFVDKNEAVHT